MHFKILEVGKVLLLIFLAFNCKTESRDEAIVCSTPKNDLPIGTPIVIPGRFFISVEWMFGREVAQMEKILRVCQMCVHYKIVNKRGRVIKRNEKKISRRHIAISTKIGGLKENSEYTLEWFIGYDETKRPKHRISKIRNMKIRTINTRIDFQNKKVHGQYFKDKGTLILRFPTVNPEFMYFYWWKPLNCRSRLWGNSTQWQKIRHNKEEFKVDFSRIFYSEIRLILVELNEDRWLKPKIFDAITRRQTGTPSNVILDIAFLEASNSWIIEVVKNCYKQNGPTIYLNYELLPMINLNSNINTTKGKIVKKIEKNSVWTFELKVPTDLFHNTKYELSVYLDNANNSSSKTFLHTTPPTVPHSVRNLFTCSSYETISVYWKKPKQVPPTGIIKKYIIKDFYGKFPDVEIEDSEMHEWHSKEFRLERSHENIYNIQILAYNFNVTEPSMSITKSIRLQESRSLQKPSFWTLTERTSSSLTISIQQPTCQSELKLYIVNIFDKLNQSKNVTKFLTDYELSNETILIHLSDLKQSEEFSIKIKSCDEKQIFCSDWNEPRILTTRPNFEPLYHMKNEGNQFCVEWKPSSSMQEKWEMFLVYEAVNENTKENLPNLSSTECNAGNLTSMRTSTEVISLSNSSSYQCFKLPSDNKVFKYKLSPAACLKERNNIEWFYNSSRFVVLDLSNETLRNSTPLLLGQFSIVLPFNIFIVTRWLLEYR